MKEHKISLLTAILMNMNIMIGSGILAGPGFIAAISGNASFLAWPLVALIFLPMVLCTAQLSRMFPGCGGFYAYAKEGINLTAGFFSGLLYVAGYTFAVAAEVMVLRLFFLKNLGEHWFFQNELLFNIVALAVFIGLNLISFKIFSGIMNSLTIVKILPMVILIALLPFIFNPNFTITSDEFIALPSSLTFAIFGFFGFEYCCSITHLIENSEKNAPRAALFGFLATAALYMLFHFGVLNLMGAQNLAHDTVSAFANYLHLPIPFIKPALMMLIPLCSILIVFAAGNGIMNANVIMTQAIADEKLLWQWPILAKLNRYHRPYVAALVQGLIVLCIIFILGDVNKVGNLCNLGIVLSYLLPFISLFLLQRRRGMTSSLPMTILAIIATVGLAVYSWYRLGSTMPERMINSIPLLVIIVLGYVLFIFRNNGKSDEKPTVITGAH